MDLPAIQAALRERNIDAWLFYDHHHRDPIAYRVLGLPAGQMVTRRWFYLIPASGDPVKLVHKIEPGHLDSLPGQQAPVFGLAGTVRPDQSDSSPIIAISRCSIRPTIWSSPFRWWTRARSI